MTAQLRQPLVLIVDADRGVRALMRELLEEEGCRVTTYTFPPVDRNTILHLQPSLIILDHFGPGQATGWSMLQRLKRHPDTRAIPVVLCTAARRQVEELETHLAEMAVAVIPKPFDIEQFVTTVTSMLGVPVGA